MDSSAVTAVLRDERGADAVWPHLRGSLISAVNLAEVLCTSQRRGIQPTTDADSIEKMQLQVVPFDAEQAQLVADVYLKTVGSSVGFADRVCMALALSHGLPALTGDYDWLKHDIGIDVQLFRQRQSA